MESCRSMLPSIVRSTAHPPSTYHSLPPRVYSTLGHLVDIIEQLNPKDNLSTVLRDLVAEADDNSQTNSRGSYVDLDPSTIIKVAQILRCTNGTNSTTMSAETHGTINTSSAGLDAVSKETPGTTCVGEQQIQRATVAGRNLSLSKQDSLYLMKKIRDFEQKCKPLQEKNKKFLEKNMELSLQNRNLKEQIRTTGEENKTLKKSLEESRSKCSMLSRQLNQEHLEKGSLEIQLQEVEKLRCQIVEQGNLITHLKQVAADRERRMEVLQHRKKRRLRMSAEHLSRLNSPCSVVDDERSLDSDLSVSSVSPATLSDEDLVEELPHDDVMRLEKNYKKLMKEHLALQKSLTQLQKLLGWPTDPQRYIKSKLDFETDLYISQCKIDSLEECLEKYKDCDRSWVNEKEKLCTENKDQVQQIQQLTKKLKAVTHSYNELKEQMENLEFLMLESQSEPKETCDVSTITDLEDHVSLSYTNKNCIFSNDQRSPRWTEPLGETILQKECVEVEPILKKVTAPLQKEAHLKEVAAPLKEDTFTQTKFEMTQTAQEEYQTIIKGLEEKLSRLLEGQGSEVKFQEQLRLAVEHMIEGESTVVYLQEKIASLEKENATLNARLARFKDKIDAQEQFLSLTRDEREELLQVKPNRGDLNSHLRLAEKSLDNVHEKSLEKETPIEQSSRFNSLTLQSNLGNTLSLLNLHNNQKPINADTCVDKEVEKHFDNQVADESITLEEDIPSRKLRINSVPVLGSSFNEISKLQMEIHELQEKNDVLKYEHAQRNNGDESGSDSEDIRIADLRETCENLRERFQSAETSERQCRDRLKQAEKHIVELEQTESVLRDRVEEGNIDCDKLRKQIIRLQRKVKELKEISLDRDVSEQAMIDKVKYLEEVEAQLSQKVTDLERNNYILKQRLDVKEEVLVDVHVMETLKERLKALEDENSELESKLIDAEENNDLLRENWKNVIDEEVARKECLEEKIKVLECTNNELKTKLKDQETDLNCSEQSIASEINDDVIEQLKKRIRGLENELHGVTSEKDKKIEILTYSAENSLASNISEKQESNNYSETQAEAANHFQNQFKCISRFSLAAILNENEIVETDLRDEIVQIDKIHEKQQAPLKHESFEYHQQKDDLCMRTEEVDDSENSLKEKISMYQENDMNLENKIEELNNQEIRFSQGTEELENNEKQLSEKFCLKIKDLESRVSQLLEIVKQLQTKNYELVTKINVLEKHEQEISEKMQIQKDEIVHFSDYSELHVSQTDLNATCATLTLQDKIQNCAKLESEVSLYANQKLISLTQENNNLLKEISKLKDDMKKFEKVQRTIENNIKRQEKHKLSERAENLDDHDSFARDLVNYKMENEQLRIENSDLYDRLMEFDESEKCSMLRNDVSQDIDNSEKSWHDKENKLQMEIVELKNAEKSLQAEIENLKTILNHVENNSSLHNSISESSSCECSKFCIKDMADKNMGTEDFLEGVMGTLDHGKPVSSMFERIQSLEAENQALTTKLNALIATDAQVRYLSDKVKSLEQNEDSLMERVMELEDEEDKLKRELSKFRQSAVLTADLEEELLLLQEKEMELNKTIENLKQENLALMKSSECSENDKGKIAVRLATMQKMYEDEKKKVDSLLKGEEKWMKNMTSDKKKVEILEQELTKTQEKLEEIQIDYKNKLSEKDESEKTLKEELNKVLREKEILKKKLQDYEISISELEDEIAACKISESRMFHRHQQVIIQNQELEKKLSKLAHLLPNDNLVDHTKVEKLNSINVMSENPEIISETPITASIFTETELELLRNKTPDTELLGSVPLDMLRKMQEFDQREQNYQTKIQELEDKSLKLDRKLKILQNREKDLKHEIRQLQLELLKCRDSNFSLRASTSSFDFDKSESDDGVDSDNQLSEESHEPVIDIFKYEDTNKFDLDSMSQEELALSIKLLKEKEKLDYKRIMELEDFFAILKELFVNFSDIVTSNNVDEYLNSVEVLKDKIKELAVLEGLHQPLVNIIESVTSLKHQIDVLQDSAERQRYPMVSELKTTDGNSTCPEEQLVFSKLTAQGHLTAPVRECHLEISKTINVDVLPMKKVSALQKLGQSETVIVDVAPERVSSDKYLDSNINFRKPYRMMENVEDMLRQRIRESEKLEQHLKCQVSDLATDRDELHNMTCNDKAVIHEQNICISELQFAQWNLQEQIKTYESREKALHARLDGLEAELDIKEDKIKHLEELEQRLKDLVKQYKLDEKILVTKSETQETSVRKMSENEHTVQQKVQNLEREKMTFCERSEYVQMRLKDNAEFDLAQRAKNQENIMQTLQNTVIQLERFGANAHARVVDLEQVNFDLQQRLHHSMAENSQLIKQITAVELDFDRMKTELTVLHENERRLRHGNESLLRNEKQLLYELQTLGMKSAEMESKLHGYETSEMMFQDKGNQSQHSKNALNCREQELETKGIQVCTELSSKQIATMKLSCSLDDCQRCMQQANNAELTACLHKFSNDLSGIGPSLAKQGAGDGIPLEYQTKTSERCIGQMATGLNGEVAQRTIGEEIIKVTTGGGQLLKHPNQGMSRDHMFNGLGIIDTEDIHWREIESRMEGSGRESNKLLSVGKARYVNAEMSHGRDLEHGVALQSETDVYSQNDTDLIIDPQQDWSSQSLPDREPLRSANVNVNRSFGNRLTSTAVEKIEVSRVNKEVSCDLGQSIGMDQNTTPGIVDRTADSRQGVGSTILATSAVTLKERILHIENQLLARELGSTSEFNSRANSNYWKARIQESSRKLELAEKENKHLKDEINELEKKLEKKTRLNIQLESFLKLVQSIIQQKDGTSDIEVLNKLEAEINNFTLLPEEESVLDSDCDMKDAVALSSELFKKDRELTAKRNEVDALMCELLQWQEECRSIEDMHTNALDSLRGLEMEISELQLADKHLKDAKDDYNTMKGQAADGKDRTERVKLSAQIASLNTRIVQLTNSCNEKDMLIKKLVQELKKLKAGVRSPLAEELCQIESKSGYNHYCFSPSSSSLSSLDGGDRVACLSDTELVRESCTRPRPRSADVCHHRVASRLCAQRNGLPQLDQNEPPLSHAFVKNSKRGNTLHSQYRCGYRPNEKRLSVPNRASGEVYRAISDYDPFKFSQNGYPSAEIAMKKGDTVIIKGPLLDNGYVEAEINGQVGLVPAGYLQLIQQYSYSNFDRLLPCRRSVPGHLGASPEKVTHMFNSLHSVHRINTGVTNNQTIAGAAELPSSRRTVMPSKVVGPLDCPEDFHVEKVIGANSLMLSWTPVAIENSCNSSVKVTGYRIFKDNKVTCSPVGCKTSKAVIENVNIQAQYRFGIQTVGADGHVSKLSEIMYKGIEEVTSDENSDTESEMDLATTIRDDEYKNCPKRKFMAIYDYDPNNNSPYDQPSCELAFNAGDIIIVYGRQRADGFYYGEINGARGLVPTFFIEEMPQPPPRTKKVALQNKQGNKDICTNQTKQER